VLKAAAVVVILFFNFLPSSVQAQDTLQLSVKSALALGTENNAAVRIAKLEPLKQQALQREAFSYRLPQLNGFGNYLHATQIPVVFFPSLSADPATGELVFGPVQAIKAGSNHAIIAGVNATSDLINLQTSANIKQAAISSEMAQKKVRASEQQVAYEIKKTYNDILFIKSQRNVVEESMRRYTLALAFQRDMLVNGFAIPNDTLRVFTDRQVQELDLIQLRYAEENLLNLLRYQLGLNAKTLIKLTDEDFLYDVSEEKRDPNFANRADLDVYQSQIKLAKQSLRVAQFASLPVLSLTGNWQLQGQDDRLDLATWKFPQSSFVGASITIPLFNGFRREARTQQANVDIQQSTLQYQDAINRSLLEYEQQLNKYEELQRKLGVQKQVVESAQRSAASQADRYKKGLVKWLEVKDAELVLTQAQFGVAQIKMQLNGTFIELERINPSK
jgi:outer membrane protein TolC